MEPPNMPCFRQSPLLRLSNELIDMIIQILSPALMPSRTSAPVYQEPFDEILETPLMVTARQYEQIQEAENLIKTLLAFGRTNKRIRSLCRASFFRRVTFAMKRCSSSLDMIYIPLIHLATASVYLDSLVLPSDYISQIEVLQINATVMKDLCWVLFNPTLKIRTWRFPDGHARLVERERRRFGPLLNVKHLSLMCETRETLGFGNGGLGDFALEYICRGGPNIQLPSLYKIDRLWKNIMWIMPKLEALKYTSRAPIPLEDMGEYPAVISQFNEDFPEVPHAEPWRAEFQLIYSRWDARKQRDTRQNAGREMVEMGEVAQVLIEYEMEMVPQINDLIRNRNMARDLASEDW